MEPVEGTKITDLNIDCLEKIFGCLSVADLMNVADSSKQFKKAAEFVYLLQHRRKRLIILGLINCPEKWIEDFGSISCAHLKRALQILRCFGHLLSKLDVCMDNREFVGNVDSLDHLRFYINKYCTERLSSIAITGEYNDSLNSFTIPSENVQQVCVKTSDLKDVSLVQLFPNMRRLTYRFSQPTDFADIEKHFPNLEHLEILSKDIEEAEECIRIMRLNPQLRSLSIPFIANAAYLEEINRSLPNLQYLGLNYLFTRPDSIIIHHFKHVKTFYTTPNESPNFFKPPISFDGLQELNVMFTNCINYRNRYTPEQCSEEFYDFIRENPSIIRLKVLGLMQISMAKLMNILPLIEEAHLHSYYSIDEIVGFIKKKKTLKKIQFHAAAYPNIEISDILARLNDEWYGFKSYTDFLLIKLSPYHNIDNEHISFSCQRIDRYCCSAGSRFH